MTRILHLLETADPRSGGPIEVARMLGMAWHAAGHTQDLVTLDPPEEQYQPDYPGAITPLGPPRGRSPAQRYRYAPQVVPWLKRHARDYDAVIVSSLWRYQARAAVDALAGGPVPYFAFTHGMLDPWFRQRYPLKHAAKQLSWWLADGPFLARAANVLFTCEEEMVAADKAFWPYRVQGLVSGLGTGDVTGDADAQIAAFRAAVPQLSGRRFLLFLSRIHEKKGCDLLIEGFAAIAAQAPDLDLVIAGPDQVGLVAGLKAQAERLGVAARVHFPGMLAGDVKWGAFRAAQAFVLTSHQENFGMVVAEALSCHTPVLISDKVNIWREVLATGAGLVEPDTVEGSTRLLTRFLALSAPELAAMRDHARAAFLAHFHIDTVAASLMTTIEQRCAAIKTAR
jgi:glycosyltransferase involved in cell wall biosynthesis